MITTDHLLDEFVVELQEKAMLTGTTEHELRVGLLKAIAVINQLNTKYQQLFKRQQDLQTELDENRLAGMLNQVDRSLRVAIGEVIEVSRRHTEILEQLETTLESIQEKGTH